MSSGTSPNHVLIVDDEPLIREALAARLGRGGFRVSTAASAEEAYQYVQNSLPDAILLDICMPEVSGFDLLDRLRAKEETSLVPVVLLSALSDTEHIVDGLQRGASDYVVKPPSMPLLMARLHAEIDRHSMMREAQNRMRFMEHLAQHDELTGLMNRRAFNSALEFEFQRMRRYNRPLSILMLDLDEFKQVNDRYGHAVGDEVLRQVAQRLTATLRITDIVCRYGGEEFCILLPETLSEAAVSAAENLRLAVESEEFESQAGLLKITISVGVASAPEPEINGTLDLVRHADDALYEAKHNGRNRVCVYHSRQDSPTHAGAH